MVDVNIICEECFLDEILSELPNRVAKPTPAVKGKNLTKIFHQFSDSLKDIQLQYTCIDVSSVALALGTNVGNAYIYQRKHKKILKISSETKYVPATCIKLASGCTTVAFGHESGTFCVGLVDPPIHKSFDSLTAEEIHQSSITCLEWSTDGLILYAGDSDGKISMSVVKISEGILQTAIIVTEDCSAVQLSYAPDALLISTNKRTVIWPFQNEILVQVGEKERKTSGRFGCCFMPDTLQEPTKKLYAARPGLRIWTADGNGKVSSTSVFKTLLAEKPPVIRTLTGNDGKMNSSGQFGQLLAFYNQYIVTWDQSHIWVLDLDVGSVIGCHSNLGKIRDVAVCGHEIYVLGNQRERFLRRFTVVTERVLDSSCLDAVVATGDETVDAPQVPETAEKTGFDMSSALMKIPFMALESDESGLAAESKGGQELDTSNKESTMEVDAPPMIDIFDKINAIPLDEGPTDIVFTAAKKKKKKKKPKQSSVNSETETTSQSDVAVSKEQEPGSSVMSIHDIAQDAETSTASVTAAERESHELESSAKLETVLESLTKSREDLPTTAQDVVRETLAQPEDGSTTQGKMGDAGSHDSVSSARKANDSPELNIAALLLTDDSKSDEAIEQGKTIISENVVETSVETESSSALRSSTFQVQESLVLELDTPNISDASISRQDSSDSTDVYRSSDDASRYQRLDSHEDDGPKRSENSKETKDDDSKQSDRDEHVPLLADTWSGRPLPTSHTIEQLAISQKYIFCVDSRSHVYFSDPNTASCKGWEKTNFKAKQIFVDSACHFICCVEQGKAFIRGNISDANPVGNTSFQILDHVSLLATCSACTWALTTDLALKHADTAALARLKAELKCTSMWKHAQSVKDLCQLACYDNVLWARSNDETLHVRPGRSAGKKTTWMKEDKKAKWLSMSDDGTVWIITPDDEIWFKPHVTASCPTGETWYQVTLGQYIIDDASILGSTVNFFYSVGSAYRSARTTEYLRNAAKGLIQSTKDMAWSLFRDGSPRQIYCNTQSGVWLLDTRNAVHACRGQATGAYWEMVCPTGTAKSATWRGVTTGHAGYVWALQPNGDLTCFHPNGRSYNVEGPSASESIDFMSGSRHGLWCFVTAKNAEIFLRDGISDSYPQGFAWTSLSLHVQEMTSIKHMSVGGITVWAVDIYGHVWIRLGSVDGDESSACKQAWLELDCPKNTEFASVEVNSKDTMVWAVDTKGIVYAREGVRENLVIGEGWRQVEGVTLKSVCLSSYVVYGLCTTGEIVCRFGVSESNCIGDYWKKIPGNFPHISVNSAGELWAISEEKKLYSRKMKCLVFSRALPMEGMDGEYDVIDAGSRSNDPVGADDVDGEGDWEML